MRRVWADFLAFGRQYMRSRVGAFFAFAFPVILVLLFGAILGGGDGSALTLHVQDLDGTGASAAFIKRLNETGVVRYRSVPPNVDITSHMKQNSIDVALVIPKGFNDTVEKAALGNRSATINVTVYGDPTQTSYGIVRATVDSVAAEFSFQVVQQGRAVRTDARTVVAGFEFIDFFLPGVIGLTVLTNPLFGMTNVCAEYRTRKYFKFLATTTLTKGEWLLAKILFWSVIMIASAGLMLVITRAVFGGSATVTPTAILLIVAGTVEFTSFGMIIGMFVKDVETGAAVSNAIGFPMMFLGGSFFPIEGMPGFLQAVAYAMPLTYLNEGLRATMVFENEGLALTYLGVTVAIAIVLFIIPAKMLSWKSK